MVDIVTPLYRTTKKRERILDELTAARDSLERAAVMMEKDAYAEAAHKTRNIAQSAAARRCLMEQTWEIEDAAKRAARKVKAKK